MKTCQNTTNTIFNKIETRVDGCQTSHVWSSPRPDATARRPDEATEAEVHGWTQRTEIARRFHRLAERSEAPCEGDFSSATLGARTEARTHGPGWGRRCSCTRVTRRRGSRKATRHHLVKANVPFPASWLFSRCTRSRGGPAREERCPRSKPWEDPRIRRRGQSGREADVHTAGAAGREAA